MPVETVDRLASELDAEAARVSAEVDDFFDKLLPPTDDSRSRLYEAMRAQLARKRGVRAPASSTLQRADPEIHRPLPGRHRLRVGVLPFDASASENERDMAFSLSHDIAAALTFKAMKQPHSRQRSVAGSKRSQARHVANRALAVAASSTAKPDAAKSTAAAAAFLAICQAEG